jgi:hypothetical protein
MTTYLINNKDLHKIVDGAKYEMSHFNLPLYVTNKEVERGEVPSLAIIESVVSFLNSKNLLTQLVKVDYTDPTVHHDNDFEELEEKVK